jgi:hypothetical protein
LKLRVKAWQPMRLLLDECVPARLRRAFASHEVSTVVLEGWAGVKNGRLLALAAQRFDALIPVDKNLPYQQNATSLPLAVLVLNEVSNELPYLLPLVPAVERELAQLVPGSYVLIADA